MLLTSAELVKQIREHQHSQIITMGLRPKLAIVRSGDDPVTDSYLRLKTRYAAAIGAVVQVHRANSATELISVINELARDHSVHGIIVQLPLAAGIETEPVLAAIPAAKDVDGLGESSSFTPATALGIMLLLAGYGITVRDATAVVVGQGRLVGVPTARLLRRAGAHVITCDIETRDLAAATQQADILVTATGQAGLIKPGMVRPGAVIIDAGTSEEAGIMRGDVDQAMLRDERLKITPSPGGVGPLTVVALFDNLLAAARPK